MFALVALQLDICQRQDALISVRGLQWLALRYVTLSALSALLRFSRGLWGLRVDWTVLSESSIPTRSVGIRGVGAAATRPLRLSPNIQTLPIMPIAHDP